MMKKVIFTSLMMVISLAIFAQSNREGRAGNGGGDSVFVEDACEIEGGAVQEQYLIRTAIPVAITKAQEGFRAHIITPEEMKRLDVALTKGRFILSQEQRFDEHGFPFYGWTDPKNEGGVFAPIYVFPETWRILAHFQESQKVVQLSKLLLHEALHKVFPDLQNEVDINRLQEALSTDAFCEKSHSCLTFPEEPHYLMLYFKITDEYEEAAPEVLRIKQAVRNYIDEVGTMVQSKDKVNDQRSRSYDALCEFENWYILGFPNLYEKRKFKEFVVNSIGKSSNHQFKLSNVDRVEMILNFETEYDGSGGRRTCQYLISKGNIATNLKEFLRAQENPWIYLKRVDPEKFKYITLRRFYINNDIYTRHDEVKCLFFVRYFVEGGLSAIEFKSDWQSYQLMDHECEYSESDKEQEQASESEPGQKHKNDKGFWLWPWNW